MVRPPARRGWAPVSRVVVLDHASRRVQHEGPVLGNGELARSPMKLQLNTGRRMHTPATNVCHGLGSRYGYASCTMPPKLASGEVRRPRGNSGLLRAKMIA